MKMIFENSTFKRIGLIFWGIICTVPILLSLFRSGVDCDSAYYICMGERISEGLVPYLDLQIGYTPLWFYIEALFKIIFQIPNGLYWPYLLLFYIVEVLTAYFFYRLLLSLKTSRTIAYFAAGLFLLIIHWLNGNSVLLEVPFLFWGLLASWLAIEWKDKSNWVFLLVGFLCACSFLTKQYGLGFFVLVLFLIIFLAKKNFKAISAYTIGYALPIIIVYIVFGNSFIDAVFANGYGTESAVSAGYDVSLIAKIKKIISGLVFYIKYICPIFLASFLFLYAAWKQERLANMIFAYCGVLGFAVQFYFTISHHYMIPLVPFGLIIMTEILTLKSNKILHYFKYVLIAFMICVAIYKTYYNRVYKLYIKRDIRTEQKILSNQVKRYIDEDKSLYIVHGGIYYLYFIGDILPPNINTIGYSFGPMGLNPEQCSEQICNADYVIRYSEDYPYESFFTDSLKHLLETYPVVAEFQDSTILLHKMK